MEILLKRRRSKSLTAAPKTILARPSLNVFVGQFKG